MKKIILFLTTLVIVTGVFIGCGGGQTAKYKVVCTIFPQYDWIKEIVGDSEDVEITVLSDSGVDLHNYQPSVKDIAAISTCDMFVYVGGPSDSWAEDVLRDRRNKDMRIVSLFDVLGDKIKEEEEIEGADHDHEHEGDHEHEETEYDEHVWLSVKNAKYICERLTSELAAMDADNSELYTANYRAYEQKLDALDKEFAVAVSEGTTSTLLFADRFPFRYFVDDYGLNYYAAFAGCSAEANASFSTITFLASKIDELGLKYVIELEGSDGRIAKSVIDNTATKDQKVLKMDSLQSVSLSDINAGATYISLMEKNLAAVRTALGA